jgi:hypothetical protein
MTQIEADWTDVTERSASDMAGFIETSTSGTFPWLTGALLRFHSGVSLLTVAVEPHDTAADIQQKLNAAVERETEERLVRTSRAQFDV